MKEIKKTDIETGKLCLAKYGNMIPTIRIVNNALNVGPILNNPFNTHFEEIKFQDI